jgi:hypothetical protein
MRQMLLRGSLLVATLGAFMVLGAGQALAIHVNCGDTITQDTTLDSDLLNCPANGVVIGADNITLDLNGHLIDGVAFQSQSGVDNSAGHDGVTIENGEIQEFFKGIDFQDVANGRVTGLVMRDVFYGVRLESADLNRIDRNDISSFSAGVVFDGFTSVSASHNNTVERNMLAHSGNGILFLAVGEATADGTLVVRNVFSGNQYGIFGVAYRTTIQRNSFESNPEAGIELTLDSSQNSLIANDFTDNGGGIELGGQYVGDHTVSRNRIDGSHEDGIFVDALLRGTITLDRNVVTGNGDDGIDVDTARAVITKNRANGNGDLGIEAVPGVTDGGGNKARGNGDPAQCLNVRCR